MKTKSEVVYKSLMRHLAFWIIYILYQAISYGWEYTDQLTFRLAPATITATLPVAITSWSIKRIMVACIPMRHVVMWMSNWWLNNKGFDYQLSRSIFEIYDDKSFK